MSVLKDDEKIVNNSLIRLNLGVAGWKA